MLKESDKNKIKDVINLFYKYLSNDIDAAKYYLQNFGVDSTSRTSRCNIAIYYHSLGKGGAQRVISLLIPMYLELGYHVVLITDEAQQETDYGIPADVRRYNIESEGIVFEKRDYTTRALQLQKILTVEKIDILCHHAALSPLVFYDFLVSNINNVYFVLCKHQVFSHELAKHKNFYMRQKTIFRLVHKLVVLSKCEENYWNNLGVSAQYIANPYNVALLGCKRGEPQYIVWVGRLDLYPKQYLDLIPIMQKVKNVFPNLLLKIFGSGDELSVKTLQESIEKNGLQNHIFYCGYSLDLDEIFANARIQLVTSMYEAFPMNVFEGKCYGIPLVIYDLPYLELLKDKKGYISVEQRNVDQAAEAIIQILSDNNLERMMHADALDSIKTFDNTEVKNNWNKLFIGLTADRSFSEALPGYEMILDTIYGNFEHSIVGYKELRKSYSLLWRNYWVQSIKYRMLKENVDIVIYPYGEVGRAVKTFINKMGIFEKYIVDRYKNVDKENAVSLDYFRDKETTGLLFLICSNNKKIYYEIRNQLMEIVPKENTFDLFPEKEFFKDHLKFY